MVRKMYEKGTSKLEGLCFWLLVGVVFVVSSIFIAVFVPLALLGNLLKPLGR
jgi:hypothetical protein